MGFVISAANFQGIMLLEDARHSVSTVFNWDLRQTHSRSEIIAAVFRKDVTFWTQHKSVQSFAGIFSSTALKFSL